MKDKLIYIIIFGGAFIVVTAGIVFLNGMFKNIFEFDFSSPDSVKKSEIMNKMPDMFNSTDSLQSVIINGLIDSLNAVKSQNESMQASAFADSAWQDSIKKLEQKITDLTSIEVKKESKADSIKLKVDPAASINHQKDSTYKDWIKKTVSLYESMDSKKVAKIIQTYSDNVAKDLLYSMKKKKAADILSQYNPETVNRIIKPK